MPHDKVIFDEKTKQFNTYSVVNLETKEEKF